jgi:hypothetical protein
MSAVGLFLGVVAAIRDGLETEMACVGPVEVPLECIDR